MESTPSTRHQDGFESIPLSHAPTQSDTSHADRGNQETSFLSRQSTDEERLDDLCTLDSLEEILSATEVSDGREKLKNDYSDFKSQLALDFFKKSVSVNRFPFDPDTCSPPNGEADCTKTFSDCIEDLKGRLREDSDTECTRTCVITMDSRSKSKTTGAASLYLWRKIFLTTAKEFQRKFDAPIKAILCLVCHEWGLSTASDQSWTHIVTEETKTRGIQRPSLPKDHLAFDSPHEVALRLVWFKNVPKYKGWWRTYIFREYTERPVPCFAQVVIAGTSASTRNVLILLDFDGNCRKWSEDSKIHRFDRIQKNQKDLMIIGILRSLCILYNYLVEDTIHFLREMEKYLDEAIYQIRHQPTTLRLQHLLSLEDSCREATQGLKDAAELLPEIFAAGESSLSHSQEEMEEWFHSGKVDIAYLLKMLDIENSRIQDVRAKIKDQLEIQNQYRTSLLSALAAIFVPFSFVASLYGMNLKEPLWSVHRAPDKSVHTNTTTPIDQADAIVQAIKSSGPHLFDYRFYWIATVPVVVGTLSVPTLLPPILRWTVRNLIKNTVFIVPSLMLITVAISLATSIKQSFAAFTVIILFPFGGVAFAYLLYSSVKRTDQTLWCGYAITYGVSQGIDHYLGFRVIGTPRGVWMSGLLPPIYLGITQSPLMAFFYGKGKRRDSMRALLLKVKGSDGTKKGMPHRVLIGLIYYGAATAYWYNYKDHGSLIAIPWALIITNRLIAHSFAEEWKDIVVWVGFLAIWASSVFWDNVTADHSVSGAFIAYLPMSAFFLYWAYLNNKTRIHNKLYKSTGPRANGPTKPVLRRKVTLPNSLPQQPTATGSPVAQPAQARRRETASRREPLLMTR